MAIKVNFVGAPSSGKSTLCTALETMFKVEGINVDTAKEAAREFINSCGVPQTIADQILISNTQDERDHALEKVCDVVLSDAPAPACFTYGSRMIEQLRILRNESKPRKSDYKLMEYLFIRAIKKCEWFDLIIVVPPPKSIFEDGCRKENLMDTEEIHQELVSFLQVARIPYVEIDHTSPRGTWVDLCYAEIKQMLSAVS